MKSIQHEELKVWLGGYNMATVLKYLNNCPFRMFYEVPLAECFFQGYTVMIQWQIEIGTQNS